MSEAPIAFQRLHRLPPVGGAPAFEAVDPETGLRAVIVPLPPGPLVEGAVAQFGVWGRGERDLEGSRETGAIVAGPRAFVEPNGGGGIILPWSAADTLFEHVRAMAPSQVLDAMVEFVEQDWSKATKPEGTAGLDALAPWVLVGRGNEWLPVGLFVERPFAALWATTCSNGRVRQHAAEAGRPTGRGRPVARSSVARVAIWALAVSTLPLDARTPDDLETLWRNGSIDSPSGMAWLLEATRLCADAASALAEWFSVYVDDRFAEEDRPGSTLREAFAGEPPRRRSVVRDLEGICANPKGSWYDRGLESDMPGVDEPSDWLDRAAASSHRPLPNSEEDEPSSLFEKLRGILVRHSRDT